MKLADFLFQSGMTTTELRKLLGVSRRTTISRYLHGERVPLPHIMQKIIEITGGRVQLKDFVTGGNPECASIITLPDGRKKLVFPWSTNKADLAAAIATEKKRAPEQDNLSEPLREALKEVSDIVRRRPDGTWLLEGRPADLRRIVLEANRRRRGQGRPLISYPGLE